MPILTILQLIQGAVAVISQFNDSPQAAKVNEYVQDAVSTITALVPLVQDYANGNEVTLEDAREALARKDAALLELDRIIRGMPS